MQSTVSKTISDATQRKYLIHSPLFNIFRVLPDLDQTIAIIKDFEATGISAIAVHGRTKDQTHVDPVNKGKSVIFI